MPGKYRERAHLCLSRLASSYLELAPDVGHRWNQVLRIPIQVVQLSDSLCFGYLRP